MPGDSLRWTVGAEEAGARLDGWLARRAEVGSRSRAREWIARGKVFHNSREVTFDQAGERVQSGDEITVWIDRPGSSRPRSRDIITRRDDLRIVFEDDWLLVADKPPGLLVEPLPGDRSEVTMRDLVADHVQHDTALPDGSSAWRQASGSRRQAPGKPEGARARPLRLPSATPADRPGRVGGVGKDVETAHQPQALVVHRIDRDTSGLVVFAKNQRAQLGLKRQFERRIAERTYLAVLEGRLTPSEGTWTDRLVWDKARLRQRRATEDDDRVAKEAVATYRVIEQLEQATVVEIRLVTGKRNQIRVQAALRHHSLVGERIYKRDEREPAAAFDRQALHALRLAFRHPHTGARLQFEAALPDDLRRLLAALRSIRTKRH